MKSSTKLGVVVSILVSLAIAIGLASRIARADESAFNDINLEANVTELNGSRVFGSASVSISDQGLSGQLTADNLVSGHGYTVWFFYLEGSSVAGPGRFDSDVAETSEVVFHGHVGGLQVSSGATIRLVIFDHPDLTNVPVSGVCTTISATNVARANNLLTPQCGSAVAKAEFTVP